MRSVVSVLVSAMIFLCSCASQQRYQEMLDTWQGKKVSELFAQWGAPAYSIALPDGSFAYKYGHNGGPYGAKHSYSHLHDCKTTLLCDASGIIVSNQFHGLGCVSK